METLQIDETGQTFQGCWVCGNLHKGRAYHGTGEAGKSLKKRKRNGTYVASGEIFDVFCSSNDSEESDSLQSNLDDDD